MIKRIYTFSELRAFNLLIRAGEVPGISVSDTSFNIHEYADQIIILAEKIKAERLTAGYD